MADLPGRRQSRATGRRRSPVDVLAVAIPLVTAGVLVLVPGAPADPPARPPEPADLHRTTVVCPAAVPGADDVAVANLEGATGDLVTRLPDEGTVRVSRGTTVVAGRAPLAATGEDELARGLVATRYGAGSATACVRPTAEAWFTGVGASAEHASTLELVNPDGGAAVADVTVLGPTGPVEVPSLRGVRVPGGRRVAFDLSRLAPSRDELALRVVVSRGRLGASLVDVVDELGRGARAVDWLPAQAAPSADVHLLGLGARPGDRLLTVANPGDSEARVQLRLVTKESEFTPAGLEELRVPPGSVVTEEVGELLGSRVARGALGLRLTATQPVTAAMRTLAGDDLSHVVAGQPLEGRTGAVLPRGPKRLVLSGAVGRASATWVARDDEGRRVGGGDVDLVEGTSHRLALPAAATLLDLTVEGTPVVAAVESGPPGLAVVPLVPVPFTGQVPDVRPALR